MASALPARPHLEHLRREAKTLLRLSRNGDRDAKSRLVARAPGLPISLSTAQLVVAREYGFASWAQLKTVVTHIAAAGIRYDAIGHGYAARRRADPRIAAALSTALHGRAP